MNLPIIVSILFYSVFSIYIFLGIYVLTINYKGRLNQLFSLSAFLMGLWAFGFAMAASSADADTALIWRRVSAFGWGIVFSVILHFVIILVNQHIDNFKVNTKLLALIYIPTIVNILAFSIVTPIASKQYHIVDSIYGFTNIVHYNYYDYFYNLYYITCVTYSLILLYHWGLKRKNISLRSAIVMAISFSSTAIIGTLTDRLLRLVVSGTPIQAAPIIMGPALFALFYAIKKHGSFLMPVEWTDAGGENIITNHTKDLINKYLGIFLFIGSITSFIYNAYFYETSNTESVVHALGLLIIAMSLYFLPHLPINTTGKDSIFVLLACLAIPYTLLTFAKVDGAITIWIMPLFLIFLSVLYSNKLILILLTSSSLITYVIIWIYVPTIEVVVTGQEHVLRIITVLLLGWFAYSVSHIYTKKLHESERQRHYQQLMARISTELLSVNLENIDTKLINAFESIGQYSGYQRVYYLSRNQEDDTLNYDIEWCSNFINSTVTLHNESLEFNWLKSTHKRDGLYLLNYSDLPKIADGERSFMKMQSAKTSLLLPLEVNGNICGYLGMDDLLRVKSPIAYELKQYKTFTNIISDALSKTQSESSIHQLAYYDTLTGLPNRTYLNHHVIGLLDNATKYGDQVAFLFLDLDGFKHVNDSIGHAGGDQLLIKVSTLIKEALDHTALVCRYSGDEFIIVAPKLKNSDEACNLANKVLESLRRSILIDLNEFIVTSSIGIAMYPQDGADIDTLVHNADLAMYEAKLGGKNQFKLCSNEDKERLTYRNNLILYLKNAIDFDEFIVYYQPQIQIKTGDIIGFEALLRWNHPELGFIPPSVFIPLAEQCGLIKPIGEWVFNEVCQQYKRWTDTAMAKIPVAVNLSSHQFKKKELVAFIKNTLTQTNMDPSLLELEITETVAIKDKEDTIDVLKEIKSLGVTIAIDDFGTEYSSLSRLKELPIDRIKIAMKFIHGINIDPKDEAIINVIVYLAKKLGLNVIAEGVENKGQVNYLKKIKCDDIQGYYYHKPMPAQDIERLF